MNVPAGTATGRPRPGRMLLVAFAWGSCFVFISWGLRDAPVLWFATLRALLAGLVLLGAAWLTEPRSWRRLVPRGAALWALIAALAVTNVTVAFAAMFAAATGTTAGVASVLANAQPLLVILPAWWLFGERPSRLEVAAVTLGFAGLMLVAAPSGGGQGAGLALLAAVAITTGTLLARRLAGVDLLALGAWQFLLGGTGLAAAAAVVEGPPAGIAWTVPFLTALFTFAVAATAVPYVLWFAELRRASLTSVTAWTLLVPVVGVLLGVVVLRQPLTPAEGLGDAIVVAALILVVRSARTGRRRAAGYGNDAPSPGLSRKPGMPSARREVVIATEEAESSSSEYATDADRTWPRRGGRAARGLSP